MTATAAPRRGRGTAGSVFAPEHRVTTLGIVIIITIIAFEAMAVATALPTAARELHGLAYYGSAFTGFLVASVVGMVSAGWYGDRRGPRQPLTIGLGLFLVGLVIAGAADEMWLLVLGRLVQGLATGLLLTSMYVVIGNCYPDDLRPRIFAAVGSAWVVPGLAGPVIAGWVTESLGWRWVFTGLTPFVVIGGVLLLPTLRQLTARTVSAAPLDYRHGSRRIGIAFAAAIGIAAVANLGENHGSLSVLLAVGGLAIVIAGLRYLLPAGTVSFRPGVPAAVAFRGLLAGTFFGMEALVPLTLTIQHHYSPTMAGAPLMCSSVTWACGSWIQGRLEHPNRSLLMGLGLAMIGVGGLGMALVADGEFPGWASGPVWGFAGFGAGLALTSASVVMLEFSTDLDRGANSASLQLADSCLSALCTAFTGALVAAAARGSISYGTGLGIGFSVLACIGFAAIVPSPRLTGYHGSLRRPLVAAVVDAP